MRAYVIKEQTSMADALGLRPVIARTNPGAARNTDPVANTESAQQIGSRFTSEEWYSIWYFATQNLSARRSEAELVSQFRRFYNKFGPNSSYRMPQAYASALLNERIPLGGNNQSWQAILRNLQRILQQAQSTETQQDRSDLPDATIEQFARALVVATRGVNWNERDILYNIRQLRSQRDWDRVSEIYPTLRTSQQSLASVLNELNDNEKATIRRHFNSVNIDPGEEFEYESRSSLPEPIRQIPNLVDGSKEEELSEDNARAYIRSVLNRFVELLNQQEEGLGDRFDDFINNEDSREGQEFRTEMTRYARTDRVTRAMIDNTIQSDIRLIWRQFNSWQSQSDE